MSYYFQKIRSRYGFNNNPNVTQLKTSVKQILLHNGIGASESANVGSFSGDPSGNIFEIKWRKKKVQSETIQVIEGDEENYILE